MASVLTPIKYDKEHWLLPAAATLNNGAAWVNSVPWNVVNEFQLYREDNYYRDSPGNFKVLPSLYPKKHIYVREGYVIPQDKDGNPFFVPDGSLNKPYTSISAVLADPALRKLASQLSVPYDYFHIHWAVPKKITKEITTKYVKENYFRNFWCLFLGDGHDFQGHVIIEPWLGKSSIDIFVNINCVTTLQPLMAPTEENGFNEGSTRTSKEMWFYTNRHCPDFAWRRFALFANYRGLFFYKINANVNVTYTYTNYQADEYGNNSPLSALDWDSYDNKWVRENFYDGASFVCWLESACVGIYKCDCKVTVQNSLQFPDVEDNVPYKPDKQETKDDSLFKNIGKLSPERKTFDSRYEEYGQAGKNRKGHDSAKTLKLKIGKVNESEQDLFFVAGGAIVAMAMNCNKLRMANNTFTGVINEVTASGGCSAYGITNCHGAFCRGDVFLLNAYTKQKDRKATLKFNNKVDKLYPQAIDGLCFTGSTMGYSEKNSTFINTRGSLCAHAVKKLQRDEDLYNGIPLSHAQATAANFVQTLDCYFYDQNATRKAVVDYNPDIYWDTCSAVLVNGLRSKFVKGVKHDRIITVYQKVSGNKISNT